MDDRRPILILVLYAFGVAVWPVVTGLEATVDDGYYYLEIARHVANGDGSTFDGLHPTNGYHPLWLLVLVAVFSWVPERAMALLLANLLQAIFAAGAAALAYLTARAALGRFGAMLATLLWIDLTYRFWLGGLEMGIHALFLLATMVVYLGRPGGRPWSGLGNSLLLGSLCALTILARIDTLLLALILAIAVAFRGGWRRLVAFAAPVTAVCGAYAAFNLSVFRHLTPVSAAVKRDWSEALLSADPAYASHGWLAAKALNVAQPFVDAGESRGLALGIAGALVWALALLAIKCAPWARASITRSGFLRSPWMLAPWVAFSLIQFLAYGLFYHGSQSFRPWYYVCQPWLGALLVATAADWLRAATGARQRPRRWITAGAFMLCFLVVLHTLRGLVIWQQRARPSPFRETATWIAAALPQDARIGAWNAGTLGYWSHRQVINLDGLVNSWDYFERGRLDLCGYWREIGLTHVIDAFQDGSFITLMPTRPSYQRCADQLELVMMNDSYSESWSIRGYRLRPSGGSAYHRELEPAGERARSLLVRR